MPERARGPRLREARRPALRLWPRLARRAARHLRLWLVAAALGGAFAAHAGSPARIERADYAEPTSRYAHGVLGDDIEWGALRLALSDGRSILIRLPQTRVFEDIAPRLVDVDGDGAPEVVVVESDHRLGARLAIFGTAGEIAATPFIGQRNRWLAPVGIADLDGDGRAEIAYIDRPHLARVLRIWRVEGGTLVELATAQGLTNHRIGWPFIAGGIRACGGITEMITADADWRTVMATRFDGARITSRILGPYSGPESLDAVLGCE
ncbi:FG-GAP repeat domain-containing protein [Poseidonocella sedimentorum]|uniref:Repeat domain-containing protein n=1 Tax=Poseidonocella sedimentorum TaxID=871652 RepID=A0A1I6CUT5_9RHOB|nr:VCBS repeat-containing protein [Poseidonocella sedimentorum]SFQ96926.1 Repeat domain-containing protein [Poseidonocella sedimentorum]